MRISIKKDTVFGKKAYAIYIDGVKTFFEYSKSAAEEKARQIMEEGNTTREKVMHIGNTRVGGKGFGIRF